MEDDELMDHLNNPTNILNYALNISSILNFLSIRKMPTELKHKTQNSILKIFQQTIWQERNSFMISEEKLNNITKKIKYNPKKSPKKNLPQTSNQLPTNSTNHQINPSFPLPILTISLVFPYR